jgi:uncharacterized membrane protein
MSVMAVLQPHIVPPEDATTNLLMLVRWIHFLAGITWIGLLYFFNLVNVPFMKELDAGTKGKVAPLLMPRALWWFRWSAVLTVLAGITYWMNIVATDARNAQASGGAAIGSFFVIWTLVFAVEMGLLMAPADSLRSGPVLGSVVGIAVVAGAYLFLSINAHGWESNRLLSIGIGGGLGWFMLLNVWGIIWRMQKRMIVWTRENAAHGTPLPPQAARFARVTFLASRLNFYLSIPMLFFMGAASHYPMFGSIPR